MAANRKIIFTDIRLNGKSFDGLLEGTLNECSISQRQSRYFPCYCLIITISMDVVLEIDIEKSLAELKCSKWDADIDMEPIVDLTITLPSVPTWALHYTTAPKGCLQRILVTMKIKASQSNYRGFIAHLTSMLSGLQWNILEHAEALLLWEKRTSPILTPIVKCVNICPSLFQSFSAKDLQRLKNNDKWLTDSHITFGLLDCYENFAKKSIWGNLKIKLLDTIFWTKLSADPDGYNARFREKVNLVECDYVVMPMFGENHWRLGIIEKAGQLMEGNTVFHILDSLPNNTFGKREASKLQMIILKHFKGAAFKEGRIAINVAEVPRQPNGNDCGCFLIYFAKKFLSNPEGTMALIKNSFSSLSDGLTAWGLVNDDLTFIRDDIRSLLVQYMKKGDIVFEYSG